MRVKIITTNVINDKDDLLYNSGFNEIYKINSLQNADYVIATIDSIIKNNQKFNVSTKLESVDITFDYKNKEAAKIVYDHYLCSRYKYDIDINISVYLRHLFYTKNYVNEK